MGLSLSMRLGPFLVSVVLLRPVVPAVPVELVVVVVLDWPIIPELPVLLEAPIPLTCEPSECV